MMAVRSTSFIVSLVFFWRELNAEKVEVCPLFGEDLEIRCPENKVIVMSSAHYGRMEKTRCVDVDEFIGCDNNVLYLLDQWCSGRSMCKRRIPNPELTAANKICLRYLQMYLEVEFTCLNVMFNADFVCGKTVILKENEGFVSSHVMDEKNCGTSPWIISALPGQLIQVSMTDFGSALYKKSINQSSDIPLYGYIEDVTGTISFFGGVDRTRLLHTSKSNTLSIQIVPAKERRNMGFLLHYKKVGCPDLTPPAHAWYKRDGDQAVIGCEWSQKTWHLSCDGHSWSGVVGNCSEAVTQIPLKENMEVQTAPTVWLVTLVSIAIVVIVIACVTGIVCIKKYRIKQDVQKSMTLQRVPGQGHYDLDPNIEMASMLYLPYKISEEQQQQGTLSDPHRPTSYLIPQDQVVSELTPIRIWERPLPDLPDKALAESTLYTDKQGRTPGDGDEAADCGTTREDDTLQSTKRELSTRRLHVSNE